MEQLQPLRIFVSILGCSPRELLSAAAGRRYRLPVSILGGSLMELPPLHPSVRIRLRFNPRLLPEGAASRCRGWAGRYSVSILGCSAREQLRRGGIVAHLFKVSILGCSAREQRRTSSTSSTSGSFNPRLLPEGAARLLIPVDAEGRFNPRLLREGAASPGLFYCQKDEVSILGCSAREQRIRA